MSMMDLIATALLMKKLVTPFEQWPAFKLGLIDEKGHILIKRKDRNTLQTQSGLSSLDIVALNLKKLIAKIPGGSTRIASLAAALLLIKEHSVEAMNEETLQNMLQNCIQEDAPVNNVGGGQVAGTTPQDHFRRSKIIRNIIKRQMDVRRKN
jgi:hypothetical protein